MQERIIQELREEVQKPVFILFIYLFVICGCVVEADTSKPFYKASAIMAMKHRLFGVPSRPCCCSQPL